MLISGRIEPPRSIFGRIEPPPLVPRGVEPLVADDFDKSKRVSPPSARAPCWTHASMGGRRCVRPVLRASGACISGLERCALRLSHTPGSIVCVQGFILRAL